MGDFELGFWTFWLFETCLLSLPGLIAVKTENSELVSNRTTLFLWNLPLIAAAIVPEIAFVMSKLPSFTYYIILMVYQFFLYRIVTRRVRDAGLGKVIAYVCVIPLANLIIIIYLLFKPSVNRASETI